MNIGRALGLTVWAAIIAAWASVTPQPASAPPLPADGTPVTVKMMSERVEEVWADYKAAWAAPEPLREQVRDPLVDVDHLGEELEPEDYAALANPNVRGLLPPVEFAHPYRGRVRLLRGQSQEALRRICGKQPEGVLLGCAQRPNADGVPFVVLADDATVRANGWTQNLNALHEAGHLNGAWTHDGWRDLAQIGAPAAASPRPVETPAKPIVVAQADVPPEDQYVDEPPLPRRHPRPRYGPEGRPWHYGPPVYGPPPGWILIPSEQRAMPCLPTLLTFGVLRFCI
jgi:hypothetical protein